MLPYDMRPPGGQINLMLCCVATSFKPQVVSAPQKHAMQCSMRLSGRACSASGPPCTSLTNNGQFAFVTITWLEPYWEHFPHWAQQKHPDQSMTSQFNHPQ